MKRLICVLLSCTLISTLIVGCGNKAEENKDLSKEEITVEQESEQQIETNKEEESLMPIKIPEPPEFEEIVFEEDPYETNWRLGNFEMPDVKLDVREKPVSANSNMKNTIGIGQNYNIQQIKDMLSENQFISEHYVLATEIVETRYINPEDPAEISYDYMHAITGTEKDGSEDANVFVDFYICFYGNSNNFDGYEHVYIHFDQLDFKSDVQNELFKILASIFPQDISEYLVYGNDEDKLGAYDADLFYVKDLYDCIEDDNYIYEIRRDFGHEDVYFYFGVKEMKFENEYLYDSNDYVPLLSNMKYQLKDFFNESVGGVNLAKVDSLFDNYFKSISTEHKKTSLEDNEYYYSQIIGDNGVIKYGFGFDAFSFNDNMSEFSDADLCFYYEITEKDGEIIDFWMNITSGTGAISSPVYNMNGDFIGNTKSDLSQEEIFEQTKEQIKMLIKNINVSELSFDNCVPMDDSMGDENELSHSGNITLFGKEMKCDIDMKISDYRGSFEVDVRYTKN